MENLDMEKAATKEQWTSLQHDETAQPSSIKEWYVKQRIEVKDYPAHLNCGIGKGSCALDSITETWK